MSSMSPQFKGLSTAQFQPTGKKLVKPLSENVFLKETLFPVYDPTNIHPYAFDGVKNLSSSSTLHSAFPDWMKSAYSGSQPEPKPKPKPRKNSFPPETFVSFNPDGKPLNFAAANPFISNKNDKKDTSAVPEAVNQIIKFLPEHLKNRTIVLVPKNFAQGDVFVQSNVFDQLYPKVPVETPAWSDLISSALSGQKINLNIPSSKSDSNSGSNVPLQRSFPLNGRVPDLDAKTSNVKYTGYIQDTQSDIDVTQMTQNGGRASKNTLQPSKSQAIDIQPAYVLTGPIDDVLNAGEFPAISMTFKPHSAEITSSSSEIPWKEHSRTSTYVENNREPLSISHDQQISLKVVPNYRQQLFPVNPRKISSASSISRASKALRKASAPPGFSPDVSRRNHIIRKSSVLSPGSLPLPPPSIQPHDMSEKFRNQFQGLQSAAPSSPTPPDDNYHLSSKTNSSPPRSLPGRVSLEFKSPEEPDYLGAEFKVDLKYNGAQQSNSSQSDGIKSFHSLPIGFSNSSSQVSNKTQHQWRGKSYPQAAEAYKFNIGITHNEESQANASSIQSPSFPASNNQDHEFSFGGPSPRKLEFENHKISEAIQLHQIPVPKVATSEVSNHDQSGSHQKSYSGYGEPLERSPSAYNMSSLQGSKYNFMNSSQTTEVSNHAQSRPHQKSYSGYGEPIERSHSAYNMSSHQGSKYNFLNSPQNSHHNIMSPSESSQFGFSTSQGSFPESEMSESEFESPQFESELKNLHSSFNQYSKGIYISNPHIDFEGLESPEPLSAEPIDSNVRPQLGYNVPLEKPNSQSRPQTNLGYDINSHHRGELYERPRSEYKVPTEQLQTDQLEINRSYGRSVGQSQSNPQVNFGSSINRAYLGEGPQSEYNISPEKPQTGQPDINWPFEESQTNSGASSPTLTNGMHAGQTYNIPESEYKYNIPPEKLQTNLPGLNWSFPEQSEFTFNPSTALKQQQKFEENIQPYSQKKSSANEHNQAGSDRTETASQIFSQTGQITSDLNSPVAIQALYTEQVHRRMQAVQNEPNNVSPSKENEFTHGLNIGNNEGAMEVDTRNAEHDSFSQITHGTGLHTQNRMISHKNNETDFILESDKGLDWERISPRGNTEDESLNPETGNIIQFEPEGVKYIYYKLSRKNSHHFDPMPRSIINPESSNDFEFYYPVWPNQLPPDMLMEIDAQLDLWADDGEPVALIPYRPLSSLAENQTSGGNAFGPVKFSFDPLPYGKIPLPHGPYRKLKKS